jgi:hypothetical protein
MLYAGLDLSRKRLDFHLLDSEGATLEVGAAPPDGLTHRLERHREPIRAVIDELDREIGECERELRRLGAPTTATSHCC